MMLITTSRLKNFIEPVPVCEQTAGLEAVLEIFSQGECDRLVVVSEQQCPLGLVRARRLMPYLTGKMKAPVGARRKKNKEAVDTSSYHSRQTTEPATVEQDIDAFLEPLATLPADWSLNQFRFMVQNQLGAANNRDWALVDTEGKFQGFLDTWRLLKYLASRTEVDGNSQAGDTSPQPIAQHLLVEILEQLATELAAKNAEVVQLKRVKDEFLACMSHELKTPLTAVVGLSTLLKDRVVGELNERQARYAELIYQSGHHLSTMVNEILDLTRLETGQIELNPEPVNIAAACDRAYVQAQQVQSVKHKQSQASDLKTQFTLEIEPGLEMLVADEVRLHQMLLHLLSNALKFTDNGGEIGLKVSSWEGFIAFTVWDTGIGIPPEKQHLIFQKFQQLENPLTRQFQGAGLGLALTQSLARLHGGDVSFISNPGGGCQFTLLLPATGPPSTFN